MSRIFIETERLRLALLPGLGAAVGGLWRRTEDGSWTPILRPTPENPSSFLETSMYLLAPWSNRVRDGRFQFGGREHRLGIDWPQEGCAIHGLVKSRPWEILERTPVSAWLQTDSRWWPESEEEGEAPFVDHFHARVGYELTDNSMAVRLELRHVGSVTMPCGIGFHPHFAAPAGTMLRCGVEARYPAERCLPIGPPAEDEITEHLRRGVPVEPISLDNCFIGSADGATITGLQGGVRLSCSRSLTHTVIYAPGTGEDFVCVEPVTMANDGFNLLGKGWHDGVRELKPGDTLIASMNITLID
ncbi:MAG: hypothetical protein JJU33_02235 [Phycisphaerales bacterium]|nr:hypothetical protein [Phycisphaerales bacterium]